MRHGRLLLGALSLFAAIYAPLLLGGYATAIAVEMLWTGQVAIAWRALLVAGLCALFWLSLVPIWHLACQVGRWPREENRNQKLTRLANPRPDPNGFGNP